MGLGALVMGLLGTLGLLSRQIARKAREYGIQLALGATTARLRRELCSVLVVPVLGGCAAGVFATSLVWRGVDAVTLGIETHSVWPYLSAVASVVVMTIAVALATSRKLRGIDPLRLVRVE
jgi:predicted lysophospholipase L1 biosynthesis ABC-type transport system permease subunit